MPAERSDFRPAGIHLTPQKSLRTITKNRFRQTAGQGLLCLALIGLSGLLPACNDDMPAASYYTFTGETMADFLQRREDFSLFRRIVERAGRMDFMGSRGARTFFPATNAGVETFLQEKGYSSVEDIPEAYCDTLVRTSIVERIIYTYDLPLIFETSGDTVDAQQMALTIINRRSAIVNEMKNDSVENGVVHPVDRVIVPSTSLGSTLLDENHADFEIWYEALRRTGLTDSLYRYRDEAYEQTKKNYEPFTQSMRIGNEDYVAKLPDHRYSGFTLFIVPDKVFYEKYGDRFSEDMSMDEKIDALYDLAVEKYDDTESANIFGLNKTDPATGQTLKQRYWNRESLTSRHNPLNMFLSYHILDRLFSSTAKLVNTYGVNTAAVNPADWVGTLLDFSTIKLEKVYASVDPTVEHPGGFYVNRCHGTQYNDHQQVRGAYMTVPAQENFSLNVAYYYLDDVVAYDTDMRNITMNTRMRIDFQLLWPELTNNNMRLCGNPLKEYNSGDNSEEGTEGGGFNYYLPPGYLKNISFSENTLFIVKRPIIYWSNYQGDDVALMGTSYDVTFQLPNVPPGSYELRLGYCALDSRGIGQVYVDGVAQGLPIDMRDKADAANIGGLYNGWNGTRSEKDGANGIYSEEELQENARIMKNNGYYSGPRGAYFFLGYLGSVSSPAYDPTKCIIFYNQNDLLRRRICQVQVQPNRHHTIRIRSVLSSATSGSFSLDYMELVPMNICGPGGTGEDALQAAPHKERLCRKGSGPPEPHPSGRSAVLKTLFPAP